MVDDGAVFMFLLLLLVLVGVVMVVVLLLLMLPLLLLLLLLPLMLFLLLFLILFLMLLLLPFLLLLLLILALSLVLGAGVSFTSSLTCCVLLRLLSRGVGVASSVTVDCCLELSLRVDADEGDADRFFTGSLLGFGGCCCGTTGFDIGASVVSDVSDNSAFRDNMCCSAYRDNSLSISCSILCGYDLPLRKTIIKVFRYSFASFAFRRFVVEFILVAPVPPIGGAIRVILYTKS
mmetsp:Transcript_31595/g.38640  ORF Transcript_31595/g.38640 Transcript_31595/m.38640 type:complete len:234 (-) Transcript_31595:47-748(-)